MVTDWPAPSISTNWLLLRQVVAQDLSQSSWSAYTCSFSSLALPTMGCKGLLNQRLTKYLEVLIFRLQAISRMFFFFHLIVTVSGSQGLSIRLKVKEQGNTALDELAAGE